MACSQASEDCFWQPASWTLSGGDSRSVCHVRREVYDGAPVAPFVDWAAQGVIWWLEQAIRALRHDGGLWCHHLWGLLCTMEFFGADVRTERRKVW